MLSSRAIAALSIMFASSAAAQDSTQRAPLSWALAAEVGGEWERYNRVLQVDGTLAAQPWTIRAMGPKVLRSLVPARSHPWEKVEQVSVRRLGRLHAALHPVQSRLIFNSSFPYGYNEGPVWAGRGVTGVLSGGASLQVGAFSAALAPVVFRSANAEFPLFDNGQAGIYRFGFPYSNRADMPQRFGEGAYGRLDPGHSYARIDGAGAAVGFATSPVHWGPAIEHPLVLGRHAGGFPHVFAGTAAPLPLGPVRVHARMIWGQLHQSDFIDMATRRRLAVGVIGTISPRGMPGLEIGATRFAQMLWQPGVLRPEYLFRPFGRTLGDGIVDPNGVVNPENQIASFFGRWVFAGAEIYGEYAMEDGALTLRNVMLEPDHDAGYVIGLQRAWVPETAADRRRIVRAEILNTRMTSVRLFPLEVPFYEHNTLRQGHTHRGLALGSAAAYGGGASSFAYEEYSPRGRWTATYSRMMRAQYVIQGVPQTSRADVFHALGADGAFFFGTNAVTWELTAVRELNRDFHRDAFNVRSGLGLRYTW